MKGYRGVLIIMNKLNQIKKELFSNQNGKCFFCGKEMPIQYFELEHLQPKLLGGEDSINNLVLSCKMCNHKRVGKRPFCEIDFNLYILQLLKQRDDFRNIKREALISDKERYIVDILVEQRLENKWHKVIIELKTTPIFTSSRLNEILNILLTQLSQQKNSFKTLKYQCFLTNKYAS